MRRCAADVWAAPSFNELARDGQDVERWNLLHADQEPRQSWVEKCLHNGEGPAHAVMLRTIHALEGAPLGRLDDAPVPLAGGERLFVLERAGELLVTRDDPGGTRTE